MSRLFACLALISALLVWTLPAQAHPHVWVTSSSEVVYAADGAITGVRHSWRFDDMFSTYALQDITAKTKGVYTREELAPLAQVNVDSLREFDFFTFAKAGKAAAKEKFSDPVDYFLEHKDGALILHFTLPFKSPLKTKELALEIFDPSYFVGFELAAADPVKLAGAPANCKASVQRPGKAASTPLNEKSFENGGNANFGASFSNKITVDCP